MITQPWISLLRDELDLEYGARPRIAQLASVDERGRPRVRSVVCRRVEDEGALVATSDGRSAKNRQLRAVGFSEWVFWLVGRRKQFRVGGALHVIDGSAEGDEKQLREAVWDEISDAARALFVWPASGKPWGGCDVEFATQLEKDAPIPASFELLVMRADEVELLDLNPHPHSRRRWREANAWVEEVINP